MHFLILWRMAVTEDRKYSRKFVHELLEKVKGRTLGEVDAEGSRQFDRTERSSKITGIAGDVIEQSVFGYERDSRQECDIEIDGELTELKTTGVRVPKVEFDKVKNLPWSKYSHMFTAKEGISITGVTFHPTYQTDFFTSHFWEKSERLLIVFYEYKSYGVVSASGYKDFPIVGYCYNKFTDNEIAQLRSDWEIVRDHIKSVYDVYSDSVQRDEHLVGFTHTLRPQLMLIELVPGFKKRSSGSYQRPRYRLKRTLVDVIVRGHFNKTRSEINLTESFSSFAELEKKCHQLSQTYGGKTLAELKELLGIDLDISTKDFASKCILKMFGAGCKRLNQILDFQKAGIIAKTITITPNWNRTEDMKLSSVDFDEWLDRDVEFEESDVYTYFNELSFLFPIFCEYDSTNPSKTVFEGFKRFAFDDEFIENDVKKMWEDSRNLVYTDTLKWEYIISEKTGEKIINKSGGYKGAPNLPKSSEYTVFFRGGAADSSEKSKTEKVNGIKMLSQFFWLKGSYITHKLKSLPYL